MIKESEKKDSKKESVLGKKKRKMKKKKVLFYCQHLLGIGHLTRSLNICSELVNTFQVDFVQGGPDIDKSVADFEDFKHRFLQPLMMREKDSSLYDPNENRPVEDVFSIRQKELQKICSEPFDAAVIELFPFGRKKFKDEILFLIGEMKKKNPSCKIYCSIRDILVEKPDQAKREKKIVEILNESFDGLLIHSDENVVQFSQTFKSLEDVRIPFVYTGFVSESQKKTTGTGKIASSENSTEIDLKALSGKPKVLIAIGGGVVGQELVRAMMEVAGRCEKYCYHFALGPNLNIGERTEFVKTANESESILVTGLLSNYEEALRSSILSVSMAGYNTVMNLLSARVRALVLPYLANHEQSLRATRLEELGFMKVLKDSDLKTETLRELIDSQVESIYPTKEINISGSDRTSQILREWIT